MERKVASMSDLYGRANPKPKAPTYDAEDMLRMRAAEEAAALRLRARDAAAVSASLGWRGAAGGGTDLAGATHSCVAAASTKAWDEITVPRDLGADHGAYKWRQNQTFVEVFVLLPPGCRGARDVEVELSSDALDVRVCEQEVLAGELFAPIKAEASTWIISDGVLEVSLLKRNRRGNYENGSSNADTFWFGVLRGAAGKAAAGRAPPAAAAAAAKLLPLEHPPQAYYDCEWVREPEGGGPAYEKGRGVSSRGKSNAGAGSGGK